MVDAEGIEGLLVRASTAHGEFERTELNGVYDRDWPRWYAAYAIEHGLGGLLGHPVTTDDLARFLAGSNVQFEQTEHESRPSWAAYTARRIAVEL